MTPNIVTLRDILRLIVISRQFKKVSFQEQNILKKENR